MFSLIRPFFAALLLTGAMTTAQAQGVNYHGQTFGEPPVVPTGELSAEMSQAVDVVFVQAITQGGWGPVQSEALRLVAASDDPRLTWLIADLMRFVSGGSPNQELADAASDLLETPLRGRNNWGEITDYLIAWDIPAPPNYLQVKRAIFTAVVPAWDRLFSEGTIDWRMVSWGGVWIDDRAFEDSIPADCGCIPAADNPDVTSADEATWLDDDAIVFGIGVNGEYRAYPRQIMEVREMVNDTLGGRDLGIPYCTLCGAAQAWFTDDVPTGVARPILRTSGLLIRSNKVMYDLNTYAVFDTFLGHAVTGPLAERGVQLNQATVVTSTWGAWKAAHPDTTVLVESLALGRDPDFRNGRDANGPIFPVGDVDPRLPVHEDVIGVITGAGQPVAFQRSQAVAALRRGEEITYGDIQLQLDGGGVRATGLDGADMGSHEAFWFAWSQFHPDTVLWPQ